MFAIARTGSSSSTSSSSGLVACEIPQGTINGTNKVFTVTRVMLQNPLPILELNGVVQDPLNTTPDFTISGNTITYNVAPDPGDKHVIWYWYGTGRSATQARSFAGGTDSVVYGSNLIYNIHGDMAIGIWAKLPSNAGFYLMFRGSGVNSPPDTNEAYRVAIGGVAGAWNIIYSWEYGGSGLGAPTQVSMTFVTNIPNDSWRYIGLSRNSSALTATCYIGDGTTMTTIGTQSYAANPDGGNTGCSLVIGNQYPINLNTNIATIEEHYIWTRQLTSAEHTATMGGTPPLTNLVLWGKMGYTPEVDFSSTGSSGAVTGTTLVAGH